MEHFQDMRKQWIVKQNLEVNGLSFSKRKGGRKPIITTKIGGSPVGLNAGVGDVVYLYETGFIYERGVIKQADPTLEFKSVKDIVSYYHSEQNRYKNTVWWGNEILEKAYLAFQEGKRYFVSVRLIETKILPSPIFVGLKKYGGQNRWQQVKGEVSDLETTLELSGKIPGTLKYKLIEQLNLSKERFHLDVDHFVPRSLNGPGNIEENLVPLDLAANRGKGNKVPTGLFIVAFQSPWVELLGEIASKKPPSDYLILRKSGDNLIDDEPARNLAKVITTKINSAEIPLGKKRKFYSSVRKLHFPNFNFVS